MEYTICSIILASILDILSSLQHSLARHRESPTHRSLRTRDYDTCFMVLYPNESHCQNPCRSISSAYLRRHKIRHERSTNQFASLCAYVCTFREAHMPSLQAVRLRDCIIGRDNAMLNQGQMPTCQRAGRCGQ